MLSRRNVPGTHNTHLHWITVLSRSPWGGKDCHYHFVAKTEDRSQNLAYGHTDGKRSTVHAFYCIFLPKGREATLNTRNAPSLFSLNPGYPGNWCFCLHWQRRLLSPRREKDLWRPTGRKRKWNSVVRLLCVVSLPLSVPGIHCSWYHLQPWCPLSFLPEAILPWASSQGRTSLMNPNLPEASPTCFHTACLCPAITVKDPRAPVMFCLPLQQW